MWGGALCVIRSHRKYMNKLPAHQECPVDVAILYLTAKPIPTLRSLGVTPNGITALSFISGIVSVYGLTRGNMLIFVVFHILNYSFDCMDGQMARMYNMETAYGDLLDHGTDCVTFLLLCVAVYARYGRRVGVLMIMFFTSSVFLFGIHLSCQQKLKQNNKGELLDNLNLVTSPETAIRYTRLWGGGTHCFFVVAVVLFAEYHYRNTTKSKKQI